MRNFWISAGVQYTSYIVLTINFRAIAHGQYAEAAATAMLAALLSYTIVRRIQQGESKTTLAGMMAGGTLGDLSGMYLTRFWGVMMMVREQQ